MPLKPSRLPDSPPTLKSLWFTPFGGERKKKKKKKRNNPVPSFSFPHIMEQSAKTWIPRLNTFCIHRPRHRATIVIKAYLIVTGPHPFNKAHEILVIPWDHRLVNPTHPTHSPPPLLNFSLQTTRQILSRNSGIVVRLIFCQSDLAVFVSWKYP